MRLNLADIHFSPERAEAEAKFRPSSSPTRPKAPEDWRTLRPGGVPGSLGALEAWAVFSNHHHFIAHSPADAPTAESLGLMLKTLHVKTSDWVNRLDRTPARQVWFNFRETRLTYPRSYFARLNYTHQNPVKHGLVLVASQYPWCSSAWFERTASAAQVKPINRCKADKLQLSAQVNPAP